jgi:hypothetical protein
VLPNDQHPESVAENLLVFAENQQKVCSKLTSRKALLVTILCVCLCITLALIVQVLLVHSKTAFLEPLPYWTLCFSGLIGPGIVSYHLFRLKRRIRVERLVLNQAVVTLHEIEFAIFGPGGGSGSDSALRRTLFKWRLGKLQFGSVEANVDQPALYRNKPESGVKRSAGSTFPSPSEP